MNTLAHFTTHMVGLSALKIISHIPIKISHKLESHTNI